jgi:hypothetical protein
LLTVFTSACHVNAGDAGGYFASALIFDAARHA